MAHCPTVKVIDKQTQELPYVNKLEVVENEVQSLYQFCISQGFTQSQLKDCTVALRGRKRSWMQRIVSGTLPTLFKLTLVVAVVGAFFHSKHTKDFAFVHMKLMSLKVLPFWDWTYVYERDCLVDNMYLPEKSDDSQDCGGCLTVAIDSSNISAYKNVNVTMVSNGLLYAGMPYVILDAGRDWPADMPLTFETISMIYQADASLSDGLEGCEFYTTIPGKSSLYDIIGLMSKNDLPPKFMAIWDNCKPKAAKVLRSYTRRPYFIPSMAEMSRSNQIILARGDLSTETFHITQQTEQATWIHVVSGTIKITLRPIDECELRGCKDSWFDLHSGQAAVIPTRLWRVFFAPFSDGDSIAFSSTFIWDEINEVASSVKN